VKFLAAKDRAVTPPWDDDRMTSLTISCDDCTMRSTSACDECVVTFLCDREPNDAVIIDVAEARVVRMLGRAGLTPPLRHQRRPAAADRLPLAGTAS
jgi:hypothetical protein